MDDFFSNLKKFVDLAQLPFILVSAITVANVTLVPIFKRLLGLREIPVSHKICIIGLPRAGKTTLITALFDLIQKGEAVTSARLHGNKTINRVNKNIARLNSGRQVGPTTEGETFVFRFSYKKRKLFTFITENFDVEIADFPGEYSQNLSDGKSALTPMNMIEHIPATSIDNSEAEDEDGEFHYALFGKEFFSWIASSQEYIFTIDLAQAFGSDKPYAAIAEISARIRASWQVIEDAVSERGIGRASKRPVHLVFTKFDCLVNFDAEALINHAKGNDTNSFDVDSIRIRSNIEDLRVDTNVTDASLKETKDVVINQFKDLIHFFRNRSIYTNIIVVSMVLSSKNNQRLGVRQLLYDIIP